ncbi:M1 family aminopeptidase [Leucobacter massiliensis]|nr:M1 family aminopeptidase [Leucobacter massiliensis]
MIETSNPKDTMTPTRPPNGARPRRHLSIAATLALAAGMLVLPAQAAFAAEPIDGAPTAGDTVFPNVGNSGYDALDYAVAIAWSPDTVQSDGLVSGTIESATTTMTANASQPLRSFTLDFEGMEVDSVTVNGEPANWVRDVDAAAIKYKLVVTPATPVSGEFTTTISYHGVPVTHIDADGSAEGWSRTSDGAILLGQPVGMMAGFPHNNTPADKATYTFTVDIPSQLSAANGTGLSDAAVVSNGELVSRTPSEDATRTTWIWRQNQQMASELAVIGIGRYDIIETQLALSDGRVIPSWSFMDSTLSAANKTTITNRVNQLETITRNLESVYGPYPGNSTGVIVDTVPAEINYALETQDRSFFPSVNSVNGNTLIHELVHQWYGDHVSPTTWTDIWIGEGMATWGPTHYNSAAGFGSGSSTEQTYFNSWNSVPATSVNWSIPPGAQTDSAALYGYQTYTRSAQFWEALKIAIGDEAFFGVVRQWQDRFGGTSVSGSELKALAEELSGRDLTAFWEDWILTPGKPDWPEKLTASLASDRSDAVGRGDRVEYTLSAENTGRIPLASSVVTVDVSSVLARAAIEEPLAEGLTLDGTTLSWAVPATATGASSTVAFAAVVDDAASGGTLEAQATVATLGGTCVSCGTSLEVTEYELSPAPKPTVSGPARAGETLTAQAAGWPEGTTFAYQWSVGGKPVDGATAQTFAVPETAVGSPVTVTVTGTKAGYLPTKATSDPTAPVAPAPKPGPFRDVTPSTKFSKEINWMAEAGLATGIRKTDANGAVYFDYEPKTAVTREAVAAFLFRLEAPRGYTAPKVSPFADVRPGDKFYREIAWMHEAGLARGIKQPAGKPDYAPKATITREAMAAFMYRKDARGGFVAPKSSPFADVRPGDRFYREIAWMYDSGLSTGIKQASGKPAYAPKANMSREAMAAFLYRAEH